MATGAEERHAGPTPETASRAPEAEGPVAGPAGRHGRPTARDTAPERHPGDVASRPRPIFPDEPIRGGPDADQPYALSPHAKRPSQNPLVRIYGPGPDGATCKGCRHFSGGPRYTGPYGGHYSGRYHKCDLRVRTAGPGSDHRAGWRACGRYDPGAASPEALDDG